MIAGREVLVRSSSQVFSRHQHRSFLQMLPSSGGSRSWFVSIHMLCVSSLTYSLINHCYHHHPQLFVYQKFRYSEFKKNNKNK